MSDILKRYIISRDLGVGRNSFVWLAKSRLENEYVAIKEFPRIKLSEQQNHPVALFFRNEKSFFDLINYMIESGITSRSQLKYISLSKEILSEWDATEVSHYIVLQLAKNGNLSDFLTEYPLPEKLAQGYIIQLAKAVKIMHGFNCAHMDIKLENVLLDENFLLKLTDFGLVVDANVDSNLINGTQSYMPPEVQTGQKYSPKMADIFSLGCAFLYLKTGLCLFGSERYVNMNNPDYVELLTQPEKFWANAVQSVEQARKIKITIEPKFKRLIENMLNIVPSKRPNIDQVLNDSYLTEQPETEEQILAEMKKQFNTYGLYRLNLISAAGDQVQATLGIMEIEQVGLNEFRFRNIHNDKNFERNVKKYFIQSISESHDMMFETNQTFEEVMRSKISMEEQQERKVTKYLVKNMSETCLLGVILELILDAITLYIIDVKGATQEKNQIKKSIRNQLKKRIEKVEKQNI
ncbi:unnamed protein product [Paramecium octaurelia]|uniref:Protein kinase domain-containing protein n=1 Tax=Paramecium octaurelia TaxID=43137 RepID=A0A8S1S3R2_PAROT|nr:unnamed protein product [Paramecium octaurelia]